MTVDPLDVRSQLEAGRLALNLGDRSYDLEMAPVPWERLKHNICLDCGSGGPTDEPDPSSAYWGTIVDQADSRSLITVAPNIVIGSVRDHDQTVFFEPASRFDPGLPANRLVVYTEYDVIGHAADVHSEPPVVGLEGGNGVPPGTPESPQAAEVLSVVYFMLSQDSTAYNNENFRYAIYNAMDHLNTQYSDLFGFTLTWEGRHCTTVACDSSSGMSSSNAGTLLAQFSTFLYANGYMGPANFHAAHVVSGKGNWCDEGSGYQPGRYSAQATTTGCPWSSVSILMGHEVGHNFAGDHDGVPNPNCPPTGSEFPTGAWGRARCWGRWQSNNVYVCPSPWNTVYALTGVCVLGGHNEDQGTYRPVRSMMWSEGTEGWWFEESSQNTQYIVNCHAVDWAGGSYSPGVVTGFGSWCTG